MEGGFHVGISLKYVFGYAEHQEKALHGLGHKFFKKIFFDRYVLHRVGEADGGNDIGFSFYVPHLAPSKPD